MTPPTDWQVDAACRGKAELFYASVGTGQTFDFGPALAICRTECKVREACRAWAIDAGEIDEGGRAVHGVVAGVEPTGKGKLASTAYCGTDAGHRRHLREREPVCASCAAAHRRANAEYERKRRAS